MLDFLYADHERVASIISQIEGVGALVGYERNYEKEKLSRGSVKAKLPLTSGEKSEGANYNKQLRQEYDPLWVNSKKLVELVSEKSNASISELGYGKLVSVSGKLVCLDQSFINDLLKSDAVIESIAQGVELDQSTRSSKAQKKEKNDLATTVRDFLQSLPLGIVFILFAEDNAFWFNVKRDYLALQALDIPLKFPLAIGGQWHVTGLVDAIPQDHANILPTIEGTGNKLVLPQMFAVLTQLIIPLVGLFGRPTDCYGLSPVVIHREISF